MSDLVRWGTLGNALIARKCVLPAMARSRNGEAYALATRSPRAAGALAGEHRIRRLYGRYEDLLADPDVDAVYIPLPNHLHLPWTLKALEAGKHVLCEKPLARNAEEAREMVRAAERKGRLLMEGFMYRFHPRGRMVRDLVRQGSLGAVRWVRSAFCFPMAEEMLATGANARLDPGQGGGALLDVGCYGVSVARWLAGEEPQAVQAQAVYHAGGVDVHLAGSLKFPGGCLAVVEAGFVSALQQTYCVVGTEGSVELPHDAFIPWEKDTVFTVRGKDEETGRTRSVAGADEYRLMVEHFADAVLGRAPLEFHPRDSVANMRVLDGLAQAARSGETVILK